MKISQKVRYTVIFFFLKKIPKKTLLLDLLKQDPPLSSTHKKTEAEVISAIGTILTNSKDWDQHRTRRTKNNTSHHEEDIDRKSVV